ncbi:hypothetical protein Tco_1092037, partial [Tanacetum coccineum]
THFPWHVTLRLEVVPGYGKAIRPIQSIQDFDELKHHCLTLKNMSYPHQRYAVYNTLVNEEEQSGFTQYTVSIKKIRRIHAYTSHITTKNKDLYAVSRMYYTPYPRFIIYEDSGRYQSWSLLQEIANTLYPTSPDKAYRSNSRLYKYKTLNSVLVIMESLVKVSKRRAFRRLNEDILKITILKTNMPYPSRKIRCIRACTHQRPQRNKAQYAVSRRPIHRIGNME